MRANVVLLAESVCDESVLTLSSSCAQLNISLQSALDTRRESIKERLHEKLEEQTEEDMEILSGSPDPKD